MKFNAVKTVISVVLLTPALALAGTQPPAYQVCPALTQDAAKILSSIETLKASVKKGAECQSVSDKLDVVAKVVQNPSWKEIKGIFNGSSNATLDEAKMTEVTGLIEQASYAISDTVSQLTQNRDCLDKNGERNVVGPLSQIVREITGVMGTFSGPYGAAISTGGTILSSAIEGIAKLIKSIRGYTFKSLEDEILFANQFCSFAEIQRDLNDNLNLVNRKDELDALKVYIDKKVASLKENCPECNGYAIAWQAKKDNDLLVDQIKATANLIESRDPKLEYSRCSEIQQQAHNTESSVYRYLDSFAQYENPANSSGDKGYLGQIAQVKTKLESFPKLSECLALPLLKKREIAHDFNIFIQDEVLSFNHNVFGVQLGRFQFVANKTYVKPLGDYIASSVERQKWIKDQYDIVATKLADHNYDYSTSILRLESIRSSHLVMVDIFPRYLKFQIKRNLKTLDTVWDEQQKLAALKSSPPAGFDPRFIGSEARHVEELVKLTLTETRTFIRYCDLANYLDVATYKVNEICSEGESTLKAAYAANPTLNQSDLWTHSQDHVLRSRVAEYSELINAWIALGDKRWEKR